jgi:hypothetical protein
MPRLRDTAELEALAEARRHAAELAQQSLDALAAAVRRHGLLGAYADVQRVLTEHGESLAGLAGAAAAAATIAGLAGVAARLPDSTPLPSQGPAPSLPAPWSIDRMAEELARLPGPVREAYLAALPPATAQAVAGAAGLPPGPPPADLFGPEPPGGLRLPLIESAAEELASRRLVSYEEMRRLSGAARDRSLAVTLPATRSASAALQELLAEAVREGWTDRRTREELAERMADEPAFSPRQMETMLRDSVQSAYSAGMDRLLSDQTVSDVFPYEETLPIRDDRLSEMCEIASAAGIGGSGIFRRDDPTWERLKPPRHPNCRCGRSPMTLEDAAAAGVVEAERWLRTGEPPRHPNWVPMPRRLSEMGL